MKISNCSFLFFSKIESSGHWVFEWDAWYFEISIRENPGSSLKLNYVN